jgi:PAS domain S-box-containing protein
MRDYTPKILLIDDRKENLTTLEINLRILKADIISVQSGAEALVQVKQHNFALMIIDIQMPGMNGFEVVEKIRSGRRNRHTPIIFLTAVYHDQNSVYQGYQSGAVDYITKPFNREILLSKTRVFLDLDRVKQELSDSRQMFQSIVQDQTDLICRTNRDLDIVFANRALLVSFAQTFERLNGKHFVDWIDADDLQNFRDAINILTPTNALVKLNHQLNLSTSRQIIVTSIIRALFDTNFELMGYQLVMRDMTNEVNSSRHLAEARQQVRDASLARSQFVANMSHEIRTPMNSIIGLLEVLTENPLTDEQAEILDIVQHSAANLMNLLNDIIDLSKIDSGNVHFQSEWFKLEDEMNRTIKLLEHKAHKNTNELRLVFDHGIPDKIKGDPLRIGQILINLINNAIKFTNDGKIELRLDLVFKDHDRAKIKFTITDTGMGIEEEALRNIFRIYDQGNPEISRQFGGSGLGLAISNALCKKMGSEIHVKSTPDVGTTFWFELNFDLTDNLGRKNRSNIRILIAEDNALNQKVVGTTLRRNGFAFELAENGKEALDKFKKDNFNVVLMDIQMPVMDGYEATQEIRAFEKANPSRKKSRIIALTANATNDDRKKCNEIGMDDYMTKPFRFNDLKDIIYKISE